MHPSTRSSQIYAEGGPDVQQSNETAMKYFRKAADQVHVLWGSTASSSLILSDALLNRAVACLVDTAARHKRHEQVEWDTFHVGCVVVHTH